MTKQEIEAVLERVRSWPEHRQEDAAKLLLRMEKIGTGFYELSEEEEKALEEGEASGVASEEEVEAVLNRFRLAR